METNKANIVVKQFNETIEKWISCLDNYSLEMLCQKPKIDSWSLGQVYIHIIDDTKYFIEQIKTALINNANMEKPMHEEAKAMFENNAFPDILLKGPSANTNLRQPQNKDELLQDLELIKEEVNKLSFTLDFEKSYGKTEHPGFQFFNASEWLAFAEMHMRHHFRQKKRIDDILFLNKNEA